MALSEKTQKVLRISGTVLVLGGTAAIWRFSGIGNGGELAQEAAPYLYSTWTPVLVLAVYIFGAGLAFFPILPLIIATGLLFPPTWALGYSLGGSMAAAVIGFAVGRWIGTAGLEKVVGNGAMKLCNTLRDSGIAGVAAVRLFPAAPYTAVGLVAGAAQVKWLAYLLGTLIGLLPGVLIFSFLGYQIRSGEKLWLTGITLAAAFALGGAGWWRARRKERRREDRRHRKAERVSA